MNIHMAQIRSPCNLLSYSTEYIHTCAVSWKSTVDKGTNERVRQSLYPHLHLAP